jgi:PAS domain S-box-containing protein
MPHGHCYLWRPDILWLNVASDASITFAYYTIPLFLVHFVQKRKDLAFNWIFVMFALFILACGTTHLFEIWTVWNPDYAVHGILKLFTAGVSVATAFALVPLMPKALAIPSPRDLEDKARELERVNEQLRQLNASLESRVEEKTRDLAQLAAIVEFSNDAIIAHDMQGAITQWNGGAERLFGYSASEAIGQSVFFIVPPKRRQEMASILARTSQGMAVEARDTSRLTKGDSPVEVSLMISPIKDGRGKVIGASSIARDISARKEVERRLSHAAEAVAQKNQEMEQFVYTVSHDLKSPLVTTSGFLGFLKEDFEAQRYDKLPDSIKRLEDANARMSQLIDDLLQLSRVGRIRLVPEPIDMAAMAHAVVDGLSPQLTGKKVAIRIQDGMPKIVGDRKRTYQALENLISNAMKYACDGHDPTISIGSERHGQEVHVFVRDNGPGIAPKYHKKIFGLFQRLETDNRGTGVGLTIVARIMQQHGGRVWVDSETGKGATFWLAFPGTFSPAEDHEDAEQL